MSIPFLLEWFARMAKELSKNLIENFGNRLDEDDDSELDEAMDEMLQDLEIVQMCRYSCMSRVPKNLSWYEETFPNYDDKRFRTLVRCSPIQFETILKEIRCHKVFNGVNSQKQFTVEFQLALVLYRLGSNGDGATIRKISCLFGVGDGGTIDRITARVFEAILSLQSKYLKWPCYEERMLLVEETWQELPYCIAYTDGTEIELEEAPTLDKDSFLSRNNVYALKLQATCDHSKLIRHIVVGYPGSVHDARIFKNCPLATNPSDFLSEPQWIGADSAYKLTTTVMTPFRKNSTRLSVADRNDFNRYFSSHRVKVEHTFGIMKEKFPSLKKLKILIRDEKSHKFACDWIRVGCILHNILLLVYDKEDFAYNIIRSTDSDEDSGSECEDEDDLAQLKGEALYYTLKER